MQVLFAGVKNREFFKGLAPATLTADIPFRELKTPTIISHQNGEAASKPFVAVYEPFAGKDQYTVKKIQTNTDIDPRKFTHLEVLNTNNDKQIILQSLDNQKVYAINNWRFKGSFGVIGLKNNNVEYLYLGAGNELAYGNYKLSIEGERGSANLSFNAGEITIHCNQETTLFIANTDAKSAFYTTNGVKQPLEVITKDGGIAIKIPAKKLIRNLELGTIY
jgi:hypothetical protein